MNNGTLSTNPIVTISGCDLTEVTEAWGDSIACEPGEPQALERRLVGGIAASGHRNALMPFKVIHGNDKIPSNSTVYVSAQFVVNQKWSTEVYTLNDVPMVFVPVASVRLVKKIPSYYNMNWVSSK